MNFPTRARSLCSISCVGGSKIPFACLSRPTRLGVPTKRSKYSRTFQTTSRPFFRRTNIFLASETRDNFAGSSQMVYQSPPVHATLKPSMLRPTLFALSCAGGAYIWAAYATNADTSRREAMLRSQIEGLFRRSVTNIDLAMSRHAEMLNNAKAFLIKQLGPRPNMENISTRTLTLATEW